MDWKAMQLNGANSATPMTLSSLAGTFHIEYSELITVIAH